MVIDLHLKKQCVEASRNGMQTRRIYDDIFNKKYPGVQTYHSFRTSLMRWKRKSFADEMTLNAGTYPDFIPHNATVQVNRNGEVIQAWIKQKADEEQMFNQLLDAIRENTTPVSVNYKSSKTAEERMLEINLADMHFGLPNNYFGVLDELIDIINSHSYEEINIVIGQDLFHNDDFRGRTSKGTLIEKVDMTNAWSDAKHFYYNVIDKALDHSDHVNLIYVKGNHDESFAWAFVQMLGVIFPMLNVDDSMNRRKRIHWKRCFIGLTHGCETMSKPNDLRGQFTIKFPEEFAKSTVREIHCSHLHHEKESDVYGVMVRRLSTANMEDEWSDDSGFVGAHKRFMVFEWTPGKLKSIHYLGGKNK